MLHFSTRAIALFVKRSIRYVEFFAALGFAVDSPGFPITFKVLFLLFMGIRFITLDLLFLAMQQILQYLRVVHRCVSDHHAMGPALCVGSNMRFHSIVPLVAFLGLFHLHIALFVLILRRTRGVNKGGVAALRLSKQLDLGYKIAWLMLHKIRTAMGNRDARYPLQGLVEVDDAFFGGVRAGMDQAKPKDQNILWHIQERRTDSDMVSNVCVFIASLYKVLEQTRH